MAGAAVSLAVPGPLKGSVQRIGRGLAGARRPRKHRLMPPTDSLNTVRMLGWLSAHMGTVYHHLTILLSAWSQSS